MNGGGTALVVRRPSAHHRQPDRPFRIAAAQCKGVEAGCGTGGNLALLARYGHLEAFEFDDGARDLASAKGIADIGFGALPDRVALPDRSYDLIALLDVLEHIEDDRSSLRRLGDLLRSEGRLILTVPAIRRCGQGTTKSITIIGAIRWKPCARIADAGLKVEK
jgi:SAM-dependent methyltransferase